MVPPSLAFWILASHSCRDLDLHVRTASLLPAAWVRSTVEVLRAGLFSPPADSLNARLRHLPDLLVPRPGVAEPACGFHSIDLCYARFVARLKEVDPCQARDFLILPSVRGSVEWPHVLVLSARSNVAG